CSSVVTHCVPPSRSLSFVFFFGRLLQATTTRLFFSRPIPLLLGRFAFGDLSVVSARLCFSRFPSLVDSFLPIFCFGRASWLAISLRFPFARLLFRFWPGENPGRKSKSAGNHTDDDCLEGG